MPPDGSETEVVEERHVKPFAAFLTEHRWGALHSEMTEKFNEVLRGVVQHNKVGSLTLTLKVAPAPSGEFTVHVIEKVDAKVPVGNVPPALFFVDDDGNLCRNDPRQQALPGLRSVESEHVEPREVGHGAG